MGLATTYPPPNRPNHLKRGDQAGRDRDFPYRPKDRHDHTATSRMTCATGLGAATTPGLVAPQVVTEAHALTPMADLAGRWGVTSNTVSRRLAFLGIKPIRQGNFRFLDPEQLELAERLQQHILSGQPMEAFPRPDQTEGGQVVRRVAPSPQVAGLALQAEQLAAMAALMKPAGNPLQRARGLAEAADQALVLTNDDLAELLGQGVSSWRDGHEAFGYRFNRHQQGRQVLWTVERAITAGSNVRALPSTSHGTSRTVGFGSVIEARVEVLSSGAALFARNAIS